MEVLLFGMIAEKANTDRVQISATSLSELRTALISRIPELDRMSYAIAVDRAVVHTDLALNGTEEIAVLPPFAGG
ncbi:MAG: MoaD/ThiS family protein [Flavobacteriales bacterium]|nr:MoaD/ThiS family protein [Flavobacteriales bacterium]MBP7155005.1 MoaD/ThiS family protein [Flavobacteriales bacterium]HQV74211.1 MoaD/ThiS family protein [Flavobacteriales bacterium]HQW40608.1 MoaD/ThiS family protein [Flavobacteriales bacterium]